MNSELPTPSRPAESAALNAAGCIGFVSPVTGAALQRDGDAWCTADGAERYAVRDGIARFVPASSYADAFGLQWQRHAATQLDSVTGNAESRDRLLRCLGAPLSSLRGARVLEAAAGAGRFTEHLLAAGAAVHAVDLSAAIDVNASLARTQAPHAAYQPAQADLRQLPYPAQVFDVVLCLGALQHTPSPEESLAALYRHVRPGGLLVVDHYTWTPGVFTNPREGVRQVLKRLPPRAAEHVVDALVDTLFPVHWRLRKVRALHGPLCLVSPLLLYFRSHPQLTRAQHEALTRLDTFDALTDRYKHRRTQGQLEAMLRALGAVDVEVWRGGNGVEARARRPR